MTKKEEKEGNLKDSLSKLSGIVEWFDSQEEIDVEKGLEKVKEAAKLIKSSKTRLKEIENKFKEIKKEVDDEIEELEEEEKEGIKAEDLPF